MSEPSFDTFKEIIRAFPTAKRFVICEGYLKPIFKSAWFCWGVSSNDKNLNAQIAFALKNAILQEYGMSINFINETRDWGTREIKYIIQKVDEMYEPTISDPKQTLANKDKEVLQSKKISRYFPNARMIELDEFSIDPNKLIRIKLFKQVFDKPQYVRVVETLHKVRNLAQSETNDKMLSKQNGNGYDVYQSVQQKREQHRLDELKRNENKVAEMMPIFNAYKASQESIMSQKQIEKQQISNEYELKRQEINLLKNRFNVVESEINAIQKSYVELCPLIYTPEYKRGCSYNFCKLCGNLYRDHKGNT